MKAMDCRGWSCWLASVVVIVLGVSPLELPGQDFRSGRRQESRFTRNSLALRKVFAPASTVASRSTVAVYSEGKRVALGTVVGASGLILTKASELKADPEVQFAAEDQRVPVRVLGTDEPNDLALLRVDRAGLSPVVLAVDNGTETGSFVVTAAPGSIPVAYGVMSVARHSRKAVAYLGVRHEVTPEGLRLVDVVPDSAAQAAGLAKGDFVVAVGGKPISDARRLSQAIRSRAPGAKLKLQVRRDGESLDLVATLRQNGDRHGPISSQERSRLWGPLSHVRIGMEEVLQHDSVIRPQDCGGPLCNLDGEVVGINIARVGRFETIALSSKVVVAALARILAARE